MQNDIVSDIKFSAKDECVDYFPTAAKKIDSGPLF